MASPNPAASDVTPPGQLQIVATGPTRPGDVVLLRVVGPVGMDVVEGVAFDRAVRFHPEADGTSWQGLMGIDLDVAPGPHILSVTGSRRGATVASGRHQLAVAARQFATRRLSVDSRFVEPPPAQEARIVEEAARLTALFDGVTPRQWIGPFRTPLAVAPNSSFGTRSVFNGQPRNPHAGADFRGPTGTPIAAPNAGTVVLAEDLYFTGQTVILDHGLGLYSLYAHLSRTQVARGDVVFAGQRLGLVGATGRVTGPHLHWAVRLNGARVDPMSLVAVLATTGPVQVATPTSTPRRPGATPNAPGSANGPRARAGGL